MQMNTVYYYLLLFCLCVFSIKTIASSDILNNDCKLDNGKPGKCIHFKNCKRAITQVKEQRRYPITCGFDKLEPIVCCEIEHVTRNSPDNRKIDHIRVEKCRDIYKDLKEVFVDSKIFGSGGIDSEPRKYTHMAALGYNEQNQTVWLCGGTLISENFILTAAHCIRSSILNLNETDDDAEPQDFGVKRVIIHPNYKAPLVYNDIALIELDHKARFSDYVRPACLHTEHDIVQNDWSATGWGVTSYNGIPADHLFVAFVVMRLKPFSAEECQTAYKDFTKRKFPNGIDYHKQVCAGHDSMDTCQGDSGGPLQIKNQFEVGYTLIGVTSYGKPCGLTKSPGVYTRVSHYLKWIDSNVWLK